MIIIYLCIFFLGASLASFLNATLYRIDKKYQYPEIITKNSHCEKCKRQLNWIELFPIFGYILIRGKCSSCGNKIPLYYPLSEMFLGISFLLFYLYSIPFVYALVILFLFVLSYYDNIYMAVSKNIVHIFLVLCCLIFLINPNLYNLIAPLVLSVILIVVNLFKKSFGIGDILVLVGLGIILEYSEFLILFWGGIIFALLYSLFLVLLKKVNIKKAKVPMIPFFSLAFLVSIFWGDILFNSLLKFLGM